MRFLIVYIDTYITEQIAVRKRHLYLADILSQVHMISDLVCSYTHTHIHTYMCLRQTLYYLIDLEVV